MSATISLTLLYKFEGWVANKIAVGAYKAVVEEERPHAEIVHDKFPLIAHYNAVIDKVRRAEWRAAEEQDKAFIKGQRYNLFRNPENLKPEQEASLKELLAMNENLNRAYMLNDNLRVLWLCKYSKSAGKYLGKWISWAMETGIDVLMKFERGLDKARAGILAFCKHYITSAKIEAFNATIARIVRRVCGYRDLECLYLEIRQEAITLWSAILRKSHKNPAKGIVHLPAATLCAFVSTPVPLIF